MLILITSNRVLYILLIALERSSSLDSWYFHKNLIRGIWTKDNLRNNYIGKITIQKVSRLLAANEKATSPRHRDQEKSKWWHRRTPLVRSEKVKIDAVVATWWYRSSHHQRCFRIDRWLITWSTSEGQFTQKSARRRWPIARRQMRHCANSPTFISVVVLFNLQKGVS